MEQRSAGWMNAGWCWWLIYTQSAKLPVIWRLSKWQRQRNERFVEKKYAQSKSRYSLWENVTLKKFTSWGQFRSLRNFSECFILSDTCQKCLTLKLWLWFACGLKERPGRLIVKVLAALSVWSLELFDWIRVFLLRSAVEFVLLPAGHRRKVASNFYFNLKKLS